MVRIISRLDEVRKEDADLKEHMMGDFKVGTIIGKLRGIIANEEMHFKASEAKAIKIKKINIPPNHITFLYAYAANKYGHAIAVGEEFHLPISMKKTVNNALFVAGIDGTIKKDDLLGVLILLPIELLK